MLSTFFKCKDVQHTISAYITVIARSWIWNSSVNSIVSACDPHDGPPPWWLTQADSVPVGLADGGLTTHPPCALVQVRTLPEPGCWGVSRLHQGPGDHHRWGPQRHRQEEYRGWIWEEKDHTLCDWGELETWKLVWRGSALTHLQGGAGGEVRAFNDWWT